MWPKFLFFGGGIFCRSLFKKTKRKKCALFLAIDTQIF